MPILFGSEEIGGPTTDGVWIDHMVSDKAIIKFYFY
jgi:hypothetical protein